jgi:hypothetical protein
LLETRSNFSPLVDEGNKLSKINDNEYVKLLLDCAKECRAVAVVLTDAALKADYLKLADDYMKLAAREKARGRHA